MGGGKAMGDQPATSDLHTSTIADALWQKPGALPKGLTADREQFVLWKFEMVKDRLAKVPYSINGRKASVTDPRDWSEFEAVSRAFRPKLYAGIGFVFREGDGLVGIDLDHCLDANLELKPWASGIVERFATTYMEVSPSGSGLKIWARGKLPANLAAFAVKGGGGIEMYSHARYFTVTGRVFRGAPLELENHADDIAYMYGRLTKDKHHAWPLQPLYGGRIPYGQQHQTLVSIAGTLRARRVCEEAILAALLAVNSHQCEKPGPPENIARIVRSTRSWAVK